jgi:hypothetical protein
MATLDFPSSPATGQTYTGSDGTTWKWDGAKWVSAQQAIAFPITIPQGGTGAISFTNGYVYSTGGVILAAKNPASGVSGTANPPSTTSLVGVMCGLSGGLSVITPTMSGRVIVTGTGAGYSATNGWYTSLRYGTGTGPAAGAALIGTSISTNIGNNIAGASPACPFSITAVVNGLTVGQAYWFDLTQTCGQAGTVQLYNAGIVAVEV